MIKWHSFISASDRSAEVEGIGRRRAQLPVPPIVLEKGCTATIMAMSAITATDEGWSTRKSCCRLKHHANTPTDKHFGTPSKRSRKILPRSWHTASISPCKTNCPEKKTLHWRGLLSGRTL